MRCAVWLVARLCMIAAVALGLAACKKAPEKVIAKDLSPWIKAADLPAPEAEAFREFCSFLAVRKQCDDQIASGTMTEEKAVAITQPMIDDLATMGEPTENVMIKLLEARQDLTREDREKTLLDEQPEVFATVILWTQKSKRAVPLLMKMAQNSRFADRAVFVHGLGRIGDPQALSLLKDLARNESNLEVLTEAQRAVTAIEKALPKEKTPNKTPAPAK